MVMLLALLLQQEENFDTQAAFRAVMALFIKQVNACKA